MSTTPPHIRAALPLRALHWLMAGLVILALVCIYSKGWFDKGTPIRSLLSATHIFAGLTVGWLLLPRWLVRLRHPLPAIEPPAPRWQTAFAHAAHLALYAGMLALPLLGVLFMQANGREVHYLGWTLPTLIDPNPATYHALKEIHENVGVTLLVLVALHAVAALWHHRVQRDNTLHRML